MIDTATGLRTAAVPVDGTPLEPAVSPDGARLYITTQTSNTLPVIDTATHTVTATIHLGGSPARIGLTG
ncbi:YncE family protein [Streptomyces sp. NPDC008121]|uniref:YncE family protein n=1 Tax=Streptomyces sp. NPDC008121 TaxID=3364809 RepID=UPI0036EC3700